MSARYSNAEKAAAKRIGYTATLTGDIPSSEWLADFKRVVIAECLNYSIRYFRKRVTAIRRDAERSIAKYERSIAKTQANANDARLVARAIAREQRRAARS